MSKLAADAQNAFPAPDGTPLGNLRHVVATYADSDGDGLAIVATSGIYRSTEPGVLAYGTRGLGRTGLTWDDLRALLTQIDQLHAELNAITL
jgi:hypothetical protein